MSALGKQSRSAFDNCRNRHVKNLLHVRAACRSDCFCCREAASATLNCSSPSSGNASAGAHWAMSCANCNFSTEKEVMAAAATQWGCPVFTPESRICEVQARVPGELMELYFMAPVHYVAAVNKLFIGFVHRIEHDVSAYDRGNYLLHNCALLHYRQRLSPGDSRSGIHK